ncbi:hypothetical protein DWF04_015635 [Cereibacter sphaeroides f. sp. denitrificans]|nr:hypothetical protein DWF04_16280 [Cereibacter sphaeroides f. sp. denitrificans]
MLDRDETETFRDEAIVEAWAAAVSAVSPHLPGGKPMPVDRIGIARRIAQRLGCTAECVLEVVGAEHG